MEQKFSRRRRRCRPCPRPPSPLSPPWPPNAQTAATDELAWCPPPPLFPLAAKVPLCCSLCPTCLVAPLLLRLMPHPTPPPRCVYCCVAQKVYCCVWRGGVGASPASAGPARPEEVARRQGPEQSPRALSAPVPLPPRKPRSRPSSSPPPRAPSRATPPSGDPSLLRRVSSPRCSSTETYPCGRPCVTLIAAAVSRPRPWRRAALPLPAPLVRGDVPPRPSVQGVRPGG